MQLRPGCAAREPQHEERERGLAVPRREPVDLQASVALLPRVPVAERALNSGHSSSVTEVGVDLDLVDVLVVVFDREPHCSNALG